MLGSMLGKHWWLSGIGQGLFQKEVGWFDNISVGWRPFWSGNQSFCMMKNQRGFKEHS
ncbi:hypothetical protein RchiOBHm_Chr5g0066851 [Rosa chinensis]|uniref:Uncharacterized protein n=1 Tax=Rosa chinensis TaxID=74649 RepID=A0A2P6QJB0_ROSCH|nr:hypothetical protein RchiOBHm_Chr5g0066851 [Rosa chinensis]